MAQTYCGKDCGSCQWKEQLACEGCKEGPGQPVFGDCELASCCRSGRHDTCDTCMDRGFCRLLEGKTSIPERRLKKRERDAEQHRRMVAKAPKLVRYLSVLFWLVVPVNVASLLELAGRALPVLGMVGEVLGFACELLYGIVLLLLAFAEPRYRTAGILAFAVQAVRLLGLIPDESVQTILLLPQIGLTPVCQYYELTAHSVLLTGVENDLAGKFQTLWKWYVGSYGAVFGGTILMLLIPGLGLLVLLAAMVAILVVGIVKLVYLWRAKTVFQQFCTEAENSR